MGGRDGQCANCTAITVSTAATPGTCWTKRVIQDSYWLPAGGGGNQRRVPSPGEPPHGACSAARDEKPAMSVLRRRDQRGGFQQAEEFWPEVGKRRVTRLFPTSGQELTCWAETAPPWRPSRQPRSTASVWA